MFHHNDIMCKNEDVYLYIAKPFAQGLHLNTRKSRDCQQPLLTIVYLSNVERILPGGTHEDFDTFIGSPLWPLIEYAMIEQCVGVSQSIDRRVSGCCRNEHILAVSCRSRNAKC